jgi:hypothetical protein
VISAFVDLFIRVPSWIVSIAIALRLLRRRISRGHRRFESIYAIILVVSLCAPWQAILLLLLLLSFLPG